jgi:hypothetical protein
VVGTTLGATPGDTAAGVAGYNGSSAYGYGLYGSTAYGIGVMGTGTFAGVSGVCPSGPAVAGKSTDNIGVAGQGGSYGGHFGGTLAPLFLAPSTSTSGPPTTGDHQAGEIYVDQNGLVFVCTVGDGTGVGTWQQLAMAAPNYNDNNPNITGSLGLAGSVNLLSAPIRVFDSRVADSPGAPSRAAGVLAPGSPVTVQVAGTTVGSIKVPAGAVGVLGNVTAFSPTGNGKLVLYPTGSSVPSVTNLNYQSSDSAIGNLCIVPLGSGSSAGKMNIEISSGSPGSANVAFDVFGFVF